MDHQKRKANLKKLQLPGTGNSVNLRKTRSAAAATTSISSYFSASPKSLSQEAEKPSTAAKQNIENPPSNVDIPTANPAIEENKRIKRTKLTTFVLRDKPHVPVQLKLPSADDFETPEKKIKKAPSLRPRNTTKTAKAKGSTKRQPSVRSAFLRNEQLFSEITAQHCIADQFSPDEVQLALAMSKSEADSSGVMCHENDEDDVVIDLIETGEQENRKKLTETVREKLQKYGFRTAMPEDYNCLTAAFMAGGNRRLKSKWANKFTALTLRDVANQRKKLDAKIESFLQQQFRTKALDAVEQQHEEYTFHSQMLQDCARQQQEFKRIIKDGELLLVQPQEEYFVEKLFEVSRLQAGHLLKDWTAIQGRDLSPEARKGRGRMKEDKLQAAYKELENHIAGKHVGMHATNIEEPLANERAANVSVSPVAVEQDLHESIRNCKEACNEKGMACPTAHTNDSPSKQPPGKKLKISNIADETTLNSHSNMTTQSTRATSPDIFADSDKETDENMEEFFTAEDKSQMEQSSVIQSKHGITTFEFYSSEEVKTCSNTKHCNSEPAAEETSSKDVEVVIDLTQNEPDNVNVSTLSELLKSPTRATSDYAPLSPANESRTEQHSLSQDTEILAAMKDYGSDDCIITPLSSTPPAASPPKVSDEEYKRLYEKYLAPLEPSKHRRKSKSMTELYKSPIKERKAKEHSWQSQFSSSTLSPAKSIDLTQSDTSEDNEDCVVLSDDEINYSIWKANKSVISRDKQQQKSLENESELHNFSVLDFFDSDELPVSKSPATSNANFDINKATTSRNKSLCNSMTTPIKMSALERSRERAEFGILENVSEDFAFTQPSPISAKVSTHENTFHLESPSENAAFVKRYSNGNGAHKFNSLLQEVQRKEQSTSMDNLLDFGDFDEFDKLIYGSPQKRKSTNKEAKTPAGLDNLLTGEINFRVEAYNEVRKNQNGLVTTGSQVSKSPSQSSHYNIEGRSYRAHVVNTLKPDFTQQTEAELLKQLYNFGIKPLKRKQAVKMLEYIYNQTHPIMLMDEEKTTKAQEKTVQGLDQCNSMEQTQTTTFDEDQPTDKKETANKKLQLQDCTGDILLRFSHELTAELDEEEYIFQTNISKKVLQPLLPLHIAWYNLVCSSPALHEAVLMFEPIDLQEIYLFLKARGYRYEPKDLKRFFDRRCIIFRYDLTPPGKQSNRHIRKNNKKSKNTKSGGVQKI